MSAAAAGQMPVDRERGFKAGMLYQFNDLDSISLANGNLNLSIPLSSYRVSADVSYAFTLHYSGNLWEERVVEVNKVSRTNWVPQQDNVGLGWRLSFGELWGKSSLFAPGNEASWQYVSPDGGVHNLYPTLHDPRCTLPALNCDSVDEGIWYARDGGYLRLREVGEAKILEFPDGSTHRFFFEPITQEIRLQYIYGPSSVLDASGEPTTNFVKFSYTLVPGTTSVVDWQITDSIGRKHFVTFNDSGTRVRTGFVDKITLAAFRRPEDGNDDAAAATYDLTYDNPDFPTDGPETILPRPYYSLEGSSFVNVRMLRRIDMPDGEVLRFAHDQPQDYPNPFSGTLLNVTLPTGGSINYTYQPYPSVRQSETPVGVKDRQVKDSAGSIIQYSRYSPGSNHSVIETMALDAGAWKPESKTVNYFDYNRGGTFMLPFDPNSPDDQGRFLSSETSLCALTDGKCVLKRRRLLKYEIDFVENCHIDYPCTTDRNRRVVSEKTDYIDDGKFATVDYYRFDGLGHYRRSVTGGDFNGQNVRETFTNYNANLGDYTLTSTGGRGPGYSMRKYADPWVLGNFSTAYVREHAADGATVTAHTESCFNSVTGFLERRRTKIREDGANDAEDLLVNYTRDASTGFASREELFGGDRPTLGLGSLCTLTLPSHTARTLRADYTTQYGSLQSKRFVQPSGSVVPFYSVFNVIDRNTGLAASTLDPARLSTSYSYDRRGRLTQVAPPGVSATNYSYVKATSSTPASAQAVTGTGSERTEQLWEFDALGRIAVEKRLMANGSWGGRRTSYDTGGRLQSVSEQEAVYGTTFSPLNKTVYSGYDPFGRVGTITTADGSETSFAYSGERLTTRTARAATLAGDVPVSVTEERDRAGRLIQVVEDSAGTKVKTDYTYDAGGRLSTVKTWEGATAPQSPRAFTHDRRGLLTSEWHPEAGTTSYVYDAAGRVTQKTTPAAILVFSYDASGRLLTLKENSQVIKQFKYDRENTPADPLLGKVADSSLGKVDEAIRNNVTLELGTVAVTEKFFYEGRGGRLSRKETSASIPLPSLKTYKFSETYDYTTLGELKTLTYPTCAGCGTFAPPSRSVTSTYGNGLLTGVAPYVSGTAGAPGITYHPNGLIDEIRHLDADGSAGPLYKQALAGNGMARPLSLTVSGFCGPLELSITQQPAARTVSSGSAAGLSVTAPTATTYQWYRRSGSSSVLLEGQNSATLTMIVTATSTFYVRVGNAGCTLDSTPATVTVISCATPDATITAPSSLAASASGSASVPVTSGATYEWTITGGTITDGSGTRQITFSAGCSGSVSLSATVRTSCTGTDTRAVAVLTPSVTVSGSQTIVEGASGTLSLALSGIGPWTLTWSDGFVQTVTGSPGSASRQVTPSATTTYSLTAATANGCTSVRSGSAVMTVRPPAPTGVDATAVSPTQVKVTWSYAGAVDRFDVFRSGVLIGSPATPGLQDVSAEASRAYVYTVRAVRGETSSDSSASDLATTVIFGDDPLVLGGTPIRAVHISQLQTAVNAVRAAAGLALMGFSAVQAGSVVRASDLEAIRSALAPARSTLGLPGVVYSRAPVAGGLTIAGVDLIQTRGGVQ